jgi:hypothetical protein
MSTVNTDVIKRTAYLNLEDMDGTAKLGGLKQAGETDVHNARIESATKNEVKFETGGPNSGLKIDVTTGGRVTIEDKVSGEKFEIWGDPHGDYFVKNQQTGEQERVRFADLKRDCTLQFGDVKITLGMTELKNGVNYVDKVTISAGDYGAVVTGVAPDKANTRDFTVSEYRGTGQALDRRTDDGVTLYQNNTERDGSKKVIDHGFGFLVMDPKTKALVQADQNAINAAEKADEKAKAKAAAAATGTAATGSGIPAVDQALKAIASDVNQAQRTVQALATAPNGSPADLIPSAPIQGAIKSMLGDMSGTGSMLANLDKMSYREIGIMLAAIMKEKQDEATELAKKMGKDPKNVNPEDQAKLQALQSDISMLGQVVSLVNKAITETDRHLLG